MCSTRARSRSEPQVSTASLATPRFGGQGFGRDGSYALDDLGDVETCLVDLRDATLSQLRRERVALERPTLDLLQQVERPRINLGGTGPPGRAD